MVENPGRLGNRMFQYASLYGLSKTNKKKPFLNKMFFALNMTFNLNIEIEQHSLENFTTDKELYGCCTFIGNVRQILSFL